MWPTWRWSRVAPKLDSLGQTEDAYMIVIVIVVWYLVLIKYTR
jgi:hypothetical protein